MRGVHLNLLPPPLDALSNACDMFRKAALTNSRAAKALVSCFRPSLFMSVWS